MRFDQRLLEGNGAAGADEGGQVAQHGHGVRLEQQDLATDQGVEGLPWHERRQVCADKAHLRQPQLAGPLARGLEGLGGTVDA